jgi:hypothetical protein
MKVRVQISPKNAFLKIAPRWRREFAEEAVEYIMAEGLYTEIMSRITGLTPSDLTREPTSVTPVKNTRHKKSKIASPSAQTVIDPDLESDCYRIMLQDPKSLPSIMLSIVNELGEIGWDELRETLDIDYGYDETDNLDGSLQMLCSDGHISVDGVGSNKCVVSI